MYTEEQCLRQAYLVQDACNVGGVSMLYHEVIISLRAIYGWDNQHKIGLHPAIVLIRDKIDDMIGVPCKLRDMDGYGAAYKVCKEAAQRNDG